MGQALSTGDQVRTWLAAIFSQLATIRSTSALSSFPFKFANRLIFDQLLYQAPQEVPEAFRTQYIEAASDLALKGPLAAHLSVALYSTISVLFPSQLAAYASCL